MIGVLSSSEYPAKIGDRFQITVLRLLKNAFIKLPYPLAWSDH